MGKIVRQALSIGVFIWTHPANQGRRLRALARAVRFQVRGRLGRRTLTPIGRNGRMWATLHYTAASKVVYANPPDWNEMRFWQECLREGDLFIDVGSNVGSYALWAADCGATVIAVEPDRDAATCLRENVALNPLPIEVIEVALGSEAGELVLSQGLDSTNRLLLTPGSTGQQVEVQTLDSVIGGRTVAGVKLDVEGVERLVLEGARETLREARIRFIQLEWNEMSEQVLGEDRAPVEAILKGYGYTLHRANSRGWLEPSTAEYGCDIFAVAPNM